MYGEPAFRLCDQRLFRSYVSVSSLLRVTVEIDKAPEFIVIVMHHSTDAVSDCHTAYRPWRWKIKRARSREKFFELHDVAS